MGRHSADDAPRSAFFREDGEPIKKYLLIPQASPVDYTVKILIGGKANLASIADRVDTNRQSDRQKVTGKFDDKGAFYFFVKSAAESFTIYVKDPDLIKSQKSPTVKVFLLLCYLINAKLRTRGGDLKDFTIEFPVSDLVKMGVFAQSVAKRTLVGSLKAIQTVFYYGDRYHGKKKLTQGKPSNLVEGFKVDNGICVVEVNPNINFRFLAGYITPLPFWAFALPNNKAFGMMWSVFYFGRQRVQSVAINRGFSVPMRTMQNRMMLPAKSKNPKRDVLNPVEESVQAINAFALDREEQEEIRLEVGYDYSIPEKKAMDKRGSYQEYEPRTKGTCFDLDHAFVNVRLGGQYGGYLSRLYKSESCEDSLEGYE